MAKVPIFPHSQPPDECDSDDDQFKEVYVTAITQKVRLQMKSYESSNTSPGVSTALEDIDNWSFDSFLLADATEKRPLPVLGQTLFDKYDLMNYLKISPSTVNVFLNRLEDEYGLCEYHNSVHATDVTHTMHYFLSTSGLMKYLTNVEIFASLFAAIVHDYKHNGRSNKFLVQTGADLALLYNDRSVQENHHLAAAFTLLKETDCNIAQNFTYKQFRQFRSLVIDMVLHTDMAFHFQMIKDMRAQMKNPSLIMDRHDVMSFVLHTCDLAPSVEMWNLQIRWVERMFEELFQQGDEEKELNLPVSPMCDRETTVIPESQIHWIDFIVEPLITTCSDLIEKILSENELDVDDLESVMKCIDKPWLECIRENKRKWSNRIGHETGSSQYKPIAET